MSGAIAAPQVPEVPQAAAAASIDKAEASVKAAAPLIEAAINSPQGQAVLQDVNSVFGRKARGAIHATIGILGTLVAIGGAAGAYFTGDTSLAIGGAVGILSTIESVLSLSHLGNS